jgi:hypothetical protein
MPYSGWLYAVQFAAPEGFSVPHAAPAHTNPGFADGLPKNLLVSIIAIYLSHHYATN